MTKKQLIDIIGSGKTTYLYFYAPWCEECRKVKSLVDKQVEPFVHINGGEHEELLDAFSIDFYPTIVEITGTKKKTYSGSKAVKDLLK